MSRPIFLTEYDIEGSTEKRARAEGLPWPPYVVMGGRVYYSRRLVACWFEQQAGVHQAQPVEMADGDEFWQAGQGAKARRMPGQARIDGDEANPEEAEAAAMTAARQERTRVVEDALAAVITEIIETMPLSDEARKRMTELLGGGDGDDG